MKRFIVALIFVLALSALSAKSVVPNVLAFADLVKNTKYSTYSDYENVLNYDTIDASHIEKEDFLSDFIEFTKKENLYCTPVHIDGIKDKMLAMMQIQGSGRFPYLRIFRFNKKTKMWTIYFSMFDNTDSGCGLVYPVEYKGSTYFLEVEQNFENKRLVSYNLLSLYKKQWETVARARARYVYNLSDEQKEWISEEKIEKMAAFDYSFLGIADEQRGNIVLDVEKWKVVAKLHQTSVGYMPSYFQIKLFTKAREVFSAHGKSFENEKEIFAHDNVLNAGQWGFDIVQKNGKWYLVLIGMGKAGESRVSTIEDFWLNVLDLESLDVVHHSFIKSEIDFSMEYK